MRTMQLLNLLYFSLSPYIFTASARSGPLANDLNGAGGTQDLVPRQLSDPINNENFLRRAFQGCRCSS